MNLRSIGIGVLIALVIIILSVLLLLPVALIMVSALKKGLEFYVEAIQNEFTLSALWLTLKVALWVVPLNTLFGLCAAWAISKYAFKGRALLNTLIDLPLSVSPVIAGMIFILSVGAASPLGTWLLDHDFKIIFALPGIVLGTLFVTFPMVARELIPLMESQGNEEEEAALSLGANGFQTFLKITLPKIKWGLLYGIILCNARAMGEFGAVSVVSGHIRGQTNTLPLHVEVLYNEYQFAAAFAVSSLLVGLAFVTLILKQWLGVKKAEY